MALSLERPKGVPLELHLQVGEVERIPGLSDLIVSCTRDTKALRVDCISSVKEPTQELPNFPQLMPNLRSLQLSKDTTSERDQSIDPFGSFTPTLGYLKLVSFSLYPSPLRLRALAGSWLSIVAGSISTWTTLLDFLEENRSLGVVILNIRFNVWKATGTW